jgi:hypothetical protein
VKILKAKTLRWAALDFSRLDLFERAMSHAVYSMLRGAIRFRAI